MNSPIQFDKDAFREMWVRRVPHPVMAKHFGSSRSWVSAMGRKLGLPPRVTKSGSLPMAMVHAAYVDHGWSLRRIVEALRPRFPLLSENMVTTALRARGVIIRPCGFNARFTETKQKIAEAIRLRRHGLDCTVIAKRLGISMRAVRYQCRKFFGPVKNGRTCYKVDLAVAMSMIRSGCEVVDVAKRFGVTKQAIRYHLSKARRSA